MVNSSPSRFTAKTTAAIVLFIILAVLSISNHSIWLDEGVRLYFSNISIADGWFEQQWGIMQVGLANMQYAWSYLFGHSEIAYRSLNLPFLFIAGIYFYRILKSFSLSPYWVLLLAIHPLPGYYMNDAGPYIPLLAAACALYYHCFCAENRYSWGNLLSLFAWFLFGFLTHFIFGFFGAIYAYSFIQSACKTRSRTLICREIIVALLFAPLFMYVAYKYAGLMINGSERGWSRPGIFNLGFAAYSFTGLAGLGLPRNEMRHHSFYLIHPLMLIGVGVCLASLAGIFILHIKKAWQFLRTPAAISAVVGLLVFCVAVYIQNFQFWERHIIFIFPICLALFAALMQQAWQHRLKWLNRSLVVILLCSWIASSFNLRFVEKYRKDDYKGVLTYLESNSIGHQYPVLAQGDTYVFDYYGIHRSYTLDTPPAKNSILHVNELDEPTLVKAVNALSAHYPKLCLILHEKNTRTPVLYKAPELIFGNHGYSISSCDDYNTFKILILEKRGFNPLFF
ncbi:MAG: hypothetical protein UHH87_06020 [Akkermansia sp.]|nr:hypothetical protein [Akkermansia sp.]